MIRFLSKKVFKKSKIKQRLKKISLGSIGITLGLIGYSEFIGTEIDLKYSSENKFNKFVLTKIPELTKKFKGTFYLPNALLEALTGRLETPPQVSVHHEKIYLDDGDTLDLGFKTFS